MSEPRKKSWIPFLVIVVVVGAGLLGWKYFFGGDEKVEFEKEKVERGSVTAKVSATGTLESTTTVTVGSQVSGPVSEVLVDFNSPVKEGDVLARIDPSEFEARLAQTMAGLESAQAGLQNARASLANADAAIAQARAQVLTAQANVAQAKSQVASAEASVVTARAGVDRARAEMDNALIQFQRAEKLHKRELIAASELDQARTTYQVQAAAYTTALAGVDQAKASAQQSTAGVDAARSDLTAASTRLEAAQATRASAEAQVASATAQVSQSQASVEQARVDLTRTVIRSPIDGVVIERKIDAGQTVAAAFQAPELFIIARNLKRMQVRADVSEADIGRVSEGSTVSFTVDAYPDREFSGEVIQVRSAPAAGTGGTTTSANNVVVYGVLVSAPNDDNLLKPGMTATVSIKADHVADALLIPNAALRFIPPNPPEREEEKKKKKRDKKKDGDEDGDKEKDKDKKKETKGRKGTVWVIGADGPERRDLILGITDDEKTVVRDGELKEGDEVLVGIEDDGDKKRRRFRLRF